MSTSHDEDYFQWLYGLFSRTTIRSPRRSHWSLARELYSQPFRWSIRNDENRAADGQELRFEYLDYIGEADYDFVWISMECSVLEMLIALSRRVSFETDLAPSAWFKFFMESLGLWELNDAVFTNESKEQVAHAVNRFVSRTYDRDGVGGLFPLRHPQEDQRRIELWYQMSSYLLEQEAVGTGYHI